MEIPNPRMVIVVSDVARNAVLQVFAIRFARVPSRRNGLRQLKGIRYEVDAAKRRRVG
jgi:hypothetical protein